MISIETARNDYTGNNTTASYDYDFKIFNREDITLTVNISGTETTLVLNTDYEVYGAGDEAGGNILLLNLEQSWLDVNGFLDLDVTLAITRGLEFTQEIDFRNQGEYYSEGHEDALDKMTMLIQQQNEVIGRTLRQPISDQNDGLELPTATDRAGAYLGFDIDGNPVAVSSVDTTATISPYIETLLDDANAAAARATLGFTGAGGSVANADLSTMATQTIKGRTTAGTGAPEDLTATEATAILNAMVGDSGSGGTKGLAPAPASGDAALSRFLRADGTWRVPIFNHPTTQRFTSGSGTYNKNYIFQITSGDATAAATYTNNSVTFTVYATVASSTYVVMSGNGAPETSGTLTKTGGTGDSTLTFSQVFAPKYLKVTMSGGGGGGGGSGTAAGAVGTAGGTSTFGSSLLTAVGGNAGAYNGGGAGASGGTATVTAPALAIHSISGATGRSSMPVAVGSYMIGGDGGGTMIGPGGAGGAAAAAGQAAINNTGGGGGGGGNNTGVGGSTGPGGGAGAFLSAIIPDPSATYAYEVGASGNAQAAGTSGFAGGAGAAGIIIVEEYY